jgi:hypothetical protein
MAKDASTSKGSGLVGPLYTEPVPGESLGAHRVEGPKGPKNPADPMGYTHGLNDGSPAPSRSYTRVAPNKGTHAQKD